MLSPSSALLFTRYENFSRRCYLVTFRVRPGRAYSCLRLRDPRIAMKNPIDNPRKRKDTPAVSKKDFIAAYRKAAMQGGFTAEEFSVDYATSVVEDVISGRWMTPAVPWMKPAPRLS